MSLHQRWFLPRHSSIRLSKTWRLEVATPSLFHSKIRSTAVAMLIRVSSDWEILIEIVSLSQRWLRTRCKALTSARSLAANITLFSSLTTPLKVIEESSGPVERIIMGKLVIIPTRTCSAQLESTLAFLKINWAKIVAHINSNKSQLGMQALPSQKKVSCTFGVLVYLENSNARARSSCRTIFELRVSMSEAPSSWS